MHVRTAAVKPGAKLNTSERGRLADRGAAMPDGSFPIRNATDLANAIQSLGRAKDSAAARRHIIKRARALGLTAKLPDSWNVRAASAALLSPAELDEMTPAEACACAVASECNCGAATAHAAAATEPLTAPFTAPEYPTAEMFQRPAWLERGQGLTIQDDGTFAGYFHDGTGCIVGAAGHPQVCTPPTPSPTGYAGFHQQNVTLDDGTELRVGVIGNVGGHANPYVSASVASRHYSDPNTQRLLGVAQDDFDDEGIWHGAFVAGVVVPGLTYGDVAQLRRCALSGDWRPMEPDWFERCGVSASSAAEVGNFDCIGPTLVNRPGLPLVRAYRQQGRAAAVLGGLGGVAIAAEDPTGGTMQITLSDGTLLELGAGESLTISPDGQTANVAAAPAPEAITAAAPTPPGGAPKGGTSGDGVADVTRKEFDALVAKVDGIASAIAKMSSAQTAAAAAAIAKIPETVDVPELASA